MELNVDKYDYTTFTQDATGKTGKMEDYKIISYPFGKYEIKIKVTNNNEFIGIVELGVNKDFLSQEQKIGLKGSHDVDEFYKE
ncbi:MAG: hypothetical protein ABR954_09680 [Dehalococcoidales bacterium]